MAAQGQVKFAGKSLEAIADDWTSRVDEALSQFTTMAKQINEAHETVLKSTMAV